MQQDEAASVAMIASRAEKAEGVSSVTAAGICARRLELLADGDQGVVEIASYLRRDQRITLRDRAKMLPDSG